MYVSSSWLAPHSAVWCRVFDRLPVFGQHCRHDHRASPNMECSCGCHGWHRAGGLPHGRCVKLASGVQLSVWCVCVCVFARFGAVPLLVCCFVAFAVVCRGMLSIVWSEWTSPMRLRLACRLRALLCLLTSASLWLVARPSKPSLLVKGSSRPADDENTVRASVCASPFAVTAQRCSHQ